MVKEFTLSQYDFDIDNLFEKLHFYIERLRLLLLDAKELCNKDILKEAHTLLETVIDLTERFREKYV